MYELRNWANMHVANSLIKHIISMDVQTLSLVTGRILIGTAVNTRYFLFVSCSTIIIS